MSHFLSFAGHHWLLFLVLILLVVVLFIVESSNNVGGVAMIDAKSLVMLMNRDKVLVLDVRDSNAFTQGHILKAMNMQAGEIEGAVKRIQKFKAKPVIICGKAMQDKQVSAVAKQLKRLGFKDVRALKGGMPAWQKDSLPLVKEKQDG